MKVARFAVAIAGAPFLLSAPSFGQPPSPRLLSADERPLPPGVARRVLHARGGRGLLPVTERGPAASARTALAQEVVLAQTSASESFSQLQQAATVLGGGGFGAVWDVGADPARDVRMQWLDRNGGLVFPPGGVPVAATAADESDGVMAAHPASGAYVAFQSGSSVRAQYFDGTGAPRWPGPGVVAGFIDAGFASDPHLVANPGGGVFVCFEVSSAGPAHDLRCQLIDDSGSRRWGDAGASVGVAPGSLDWRVLPRGLSDGAGGLLVFWRNQRDPFAPVLEPMLMEGQRFDADGTRLWGPAPKVLRTTGLASSNGHGFDFFQVVSDGAGGAILAFDDWLGGSPPALDVAAQRISSSGELLWADGTAVTSAGGPQQHTHTMAGPGGGAFVAVTESLSSTRSRLWLFRLGPDGTHAWSDQGVLLSDPAAIALDYGVDGSFDDGLLRLAWTHQEAPASPEFDVRFAAFSPGGHRWGGAGGLPLTTAPFQQFARELVYSRDHGGVLGVWDDRRKNDWNDLDAFGATLKDSAWPGAGRFFTLNPCRLLDTRDPDGAYGGPPLPSGQTRVLVAAGACGIPASARALAVNITAVSPASLGHLTAYPADRVRPLASALSFQAGRTRANNAILSLSGEGAFALFPFRADSGATHVVVDVTGYFN